MKKSCVVGLSGGVDSAVSAFLMKERGYDVFGCTLNMMAKTDISDARRVAGALGIKFEVIDCAACFKKCVIDYFIESYCGGLTPNPCVICNRSVKFKFLEECRRKINADCVVTGHYAQLIPADHLHHESNFGKYLKQAQDLSRDQSYFLYSVDQSILAHAEFPLGEYRKSDVRGIAQKNNLHVYSKSDSQDICFIPEGNYKAFLDSHAEASQLLGSKSGDIVDLSGNILGQHKSITNYTIGQRKGLGLAGGPFFVHRIDVPNNRIIVSDRGNVEKILLRNPKFLVKNFEGECLVKIRSSGKKVRAKISKNADDSVSVKFLESESAAAPGQHCVFYDDDIVLGGGEITS